MRDRKVVHIGDVPVGGNNPISIQSMLNTRTWDIEASSRQIARLREAGCDIVRIAVPDMRSAEAIPALLRDAGMPLIADIHFDHRLALAAVDAGVHGLRLNPGNIKKREDIERVVERCADASIPIRVGVNAGSICKERPGGLGAEDMVAAAMTHIEILEEMGFDNIKVSMKSSDIGLTLDSYRLFSSVRDYPLHAGITEAGDLVTGTVRSAIGLTRLLDEGLADTVRVSLTADPVKEVEVAREILNTLGVGPGGVTVISCPTCGRTEIDVMALGAEVKRRASGIKKNIRIAVMGCAVNGPGEASDADFGIAGGRGEGLVFAAGRIIGKYPESELVERLLKAIEESEI